MDSRSRPAAVWSRRAAHAVLALVLTALGISTVYAYFLGRATRPDAKPPLEAGWVARVDVLAGDGRLGVADGEALQARFSDLFGVAVSPDGDVFVSDAGDAQAIRRITADGHVTTLAGGTPGFEDGSGGEARFDTPSGLARGPDAALYVADTGNNAIRRVTIAGVVTTVAGGRAPGYRDGLVLDAAFNGPTGVVVDPRGRVLVADTYNDRIRAIDRGHVTTIAGSGRQGYRDGPAADAQFDTPSGLALDAAGNVYVADSGNGVIRRIDPAGSVSTVSPMPAGGLLRPLGVAVDEQGTIYATDDRGRVVEITPGTGARIVAGSTPGFADGSGPSARLRGLAGLAVAGTGRLVVADPRNALVRLVTAVSQADRRPPPPPRLRPAFDAEGFGLQPLLWPADPMDGPHEITGTLGEARGGENFERFHAGLDVQAPEGAVVRVVRPGTVTHPVAAADYGTLNESMRIGAVAYVHLRVGRTRRGVAFEDSRFVFTRDDRGRIERVRIRRGARFVTGEEIGTVNPFNHVHLNVGWPGEEINPLRFRLVQFVDRIEPTIEQVHLFTPDGERVVAARGAPLVVTQPVRVVVDAWDQADGNETRRRLGLYELGYQVLRPDGTPVPGFEEPWETIRFDSLAPDPDAARLVYASGSGIPFYGRRATHFLYVVTNSLRGGRAGTGVLDPASLAPGRYVLRVIARDISANQSVRDVPFVIPDASDRLRDDLSPARGQPPLAQR